MDFKERKKQQEKKRKSDFVDKVTKILMELNSLETDDGKVAEEELTLSDTSDVELKSEISNSSFLEWQKKPNRFKAMINIAVERKLVSR